jgi:hypothetical protein
MVLFDGGFVVRCMITLLLLGEKRLFETNLLQHNQHAFQP